MLSPWGPVRDAGAAFSGERGRPRFKALHASAHAAQAITGPAERRYGLKVIRRDCSLRRCMRGRRAEGARAEARNLAVGCTWRRHDGEGYTRQLT